MLFAGGEVTSHREERLEKGGGGRADEQADSR